MANDRLDKFKLFVKDTPIKHLEDGDMVLSLIKKPIYCFIERFICGFVKVKYTFLHKHKIVTILLPDNEKQVYKNEQLDWTVKRIEIFSIYIKKVRK